MEKEKKMFYYLILIRYLRLISARDDKHIQQILTFQLIFKKILRTPIRLDAHYNELFPGLNQAYLLNELFDISQ